MVSRSHLGIISQARRGVAGAQLELGKLYLNGCAGVPQNIQVALEWLRRAMQQGLHEARQLICHRIPIELMLGSKDLPALVGCFRQAGLEGDMKAQWSYLTLLEQVPDATRAESSRAMEHASTFLDSMARQGVVEAQWKLSVLHESEGRQQEAEQWAMAAAEQNHMPARIWLALQLFQQGRRSEFLRIGQPCVPYFLQQDTVRDFTVLRLLLCYFQDRGWNDPLARAALIKAAECGLVAAAFELGRAYLNADQLNTRNKVTAQNVAAIRRILDTGDKPRPPPAFRTAVRWLTAAAESGHADAAFLLGVIYRVPAYSRRDLAQSDVWVRHAADAGQHDAQFWLGSHYWRQRASAIDNRLLALQWLSRAAQGGHAPSSALLHQIGLCSTTSCDWPGALFDECMLESIALRHPLMALRIELGKMFGLKRIEVLLTDWRRADRNHCLLIDISQWTSKHRQRVLPIMRDEQRRLLDTARYRFRDIDAGIDGPEGNYRQRLYLFRKLMSWAAQQTRLRGRGKKLLPAAALPRETPFPYRPSDASRLVAIA